MCRVLNISGFWISRVAQGIPVFINMTAFWICAGVELWKGSEYSRIRISQISAYGSVIWGSEYAWIWLNNAWINCSDYSRALNAWYNFSRVFNMPSVLNMPGVVIRQGWQYVRVTKGFDYAYAWICVNNTEYVWMCLNKQISEYVRILNVSDAVHSISSLYKLLSSCPDRGVFRALSNI